jgi:hypothetical protein
MALLSLVLCSAAGAQTVEVGYSVFCDTQQQMERYVALLDGDPAAAMNAVNAEENDPTACVARTIAFVRSPEIIKAITKNGTFYIVRVLVVGILTEAGPRATVPASFFSVETAQERIA